MIPLGAANCIIGLLFFGVALFDGDETTVSRALSVVYGLVVLGAGVTLIVGGMP